jgi:hypothetical protein
MPGMRIAAAEQRRGARAGDWPSAMMRLEINQRDRLGESFGFWLWLRPQR